MNNRISEQRIFGKKSILTISLLFFVVVVATTLSCSSKKTIETESLFHQFKRPNVGLPAEGVRRDSVTGAILLAEDVTYENAEFLFEDSDTMQQVKVGDNVDLTQQVFQLRSVEIKGKSQFTPERDGRVGVDFLVSIPKELLSEKWRVIIEPELLHNDSVIPLQPFIVKGSDFAEMQKKEYAEYRKFLEALVPKGNYDKEFSVNKKIKQDMQYRRERYWDKYYYEWDRQLDYEKWRYSREDQDAFYVAKKFGKRYKVYNENAYKSYRDTPDQVSEKKRLNDKYQKKYEKKTRKYPKGWDNEYLTEKQVPKKYRENFRKGRDFNFSNVSNDVLTEQDSVEIAKDRYDFRAIALNEALIERKDEIFDLHIKYPYNAPGEFRFDSIVDTGNDFLYYYNQSYPVVEGLRSLRVTMKSRIEAMDRSTFTPQIGDTLSYVISSLIQLVDTNLIIKENRIYRNLFDNISLFPKYPPNQSFFDVTLEDNKTQMNSFIDKFNDIKSRGLIIDNISMSAYTSLDGSFETNQKLATRRVKGVKDYLIYTMPKNTDVEHLIQTQSIGEDWDGMISLVRNRMDLMNKDKILDILADRSKPDESEYILRRTYKGDYKIIQDSVYPLLRRIDVKFAMHRPDMEDDVRVEQQVQEGYEEGIRLLQEREYTKALEILKDFSDYNTALCLTCLGYNARAYNILLEQESNANVEYLLSILTYRLQKEHDAVRYLLNACELDVNKAYRAQIDSETRALISKYNLKDRIQKILDKDIADSLEVPGFVEDGDNENTSENDVESTDEADEDVVLE